MFDPMHAFDTLERKHRTVERAAVECLRAVLTGAARIAEATHSKRDRDTARKQSTACHAISLNLPLVFWRKPYVAMLLPF
jgi:hypothetical protein